MDGILLAASLKGPGFIQMGERFRHSGGGLTSMGVLLLAFLVLLVVLTLGIFIYYKRKNRSRRSRRHRSHTPAKNSQPVVKDVRKSTSGRKRRRRAVSNPTLSETGGLPPERKDVTLPDAG